MATPSMRRGFFFHSFFFFPIFFHLRSANYKAPYLFFAVLHYKFQLQGCRARDIKLCGALAAAGLIAASSKNLANNCSGNYSIVTLLDCRKILDPVLHDHQVGTFYNIFRFLCCDQRMFSVMSKYMNTQY